MIHDTWHMAHDNDRPDPSHAVAQSRSHYGSTSTRRTRSSHRHESHLLFHHTCPLITHILVVYRTCPLITHDIAPHPLITHRHTGMNHTYSFITDPVHLPSHLSSSFIANALSSHPLLSRILSSLTVSPHTENIPCHTFAHITSPLPIAPLLFLPFQCSVNSEQHRSD